MLTALFALMQPTFAQDQGIPVTVEVTDTDGKPISTAVVRHPDEAQRHRVNAENGRWTERVLYMQDGSELVFEKDLVLKFEVSAPGFQNEVITFQVRKRKNLIPVSLEKMTFGEEEDDEDSDPMVGFGKDKPLEK